MSSVVASVSRLIESKGSPLTPADAVLAALALDLAGRLDRGEVDDRAAAPLSRELRATVAERAAGGDDVDEFAAIAARLSAKVGDRKD